MCQTNYCYALHTVDTDSYNTIMFSWLVRLTRYEDYQSAGRFYLFKSFGVIGAIHQAKEVDVTAGVYFYVPNICILYIVWIKMKRNVVASVGFDGVTAE